MTMSVKYLQPDCFRDNQDGGRGKHLNLQDAQPYQNYN